VRRAGAARRLAGARHRGTYEGKLKCEATDDGIDSKSKQDVTVEVLDMGVDGLTFDVVAVQDSIESFVIVDAKKTENGILSGVSCTLSSNTLTGALARLEVHTKTGKVEATLKGVLIGMSVKNTASSSCKLDVKRVSTAAPQVTLCGPI
jgi:hypothetical protein